MTEHLCSRCGERKPLSQFPLRSDRPGRPAAYCRSCKNAYDRSWYTRNKQRHKRSVAVIKRAQIARNRRIVTEAKDVPCHDCGQRYPSYVMDFDHVRGTKVGSIARMVQHPVSSAVLRQEIEKCEVVCANCHRERTFVAGRGRGREPR